jgi:hypothetical protein
MAIRDSGHDQDRSAGGAFRVHGDAPRPVRAECTRIARRLLAEGHRVIGLVPADDRTGVPPVTTQLATSLTELSGSAVGMIDANPHHPGAAASAPEPGDPRYAVRWLGEALALVTPAARLAPGATVPELARVLLEEQDDFGALLIDLTGFDRMGEHASAAACCDAVVVVARAHRTRERDLRATAAALPRRQLLGVLLVG